MPAECRCISAEQLGAEPTGRHHAPLPRVTISRTAIGKIGGSSAPTGWWTHGLRIVVTSNRHALRPAAPRRRGKTLHPTGTLQADILGHHEQIGVAGPGTRCGQHRVDLASVMGLMVEDMRHAQAQRSNDIAPQSP